MTNWNAIEKCAHWKSNGDRIKWKCHDIMQFICPIVQFFLLFRFWSYFSLFIFGRRHSTVWFLFSISLKIFDEITNCCVANNLVWIRAHTHRLGRNSIVPADKWTAVGRWIIFRPLSLWYNLPAVVRRHQEECLPIVQKRRKMRA